MKPNKIARRAESEPLDDRVLQHYAAGAADSADPGERDARAMAAELLMLRDLMSGEPDADAKMRTLTGWFTPLAPKAEDIHIRDIARGIATTYRYKGQTLDQLLTVAEHSVLVSMYVEPKYARQALLHDASEAYLADIVGPVKLTQAFGPFRAAEDRLQAAIYQRFGVTTTPDSDHAVHAVDKRICSDEMPQLLRPCLALADAEAHHAAHMTRALARYGTPYGAAIPCLPPARAEYVFLARFAELFPELAE